VIDKFVSCYLHAYLMLTSCYPNACLMLPACFHYASGLLLSCLSAPPHKRKAKKKRFQNAPRESAKMVENGGFTWFQCVAKATK